MQFIDTHAHIYLEEFNTDLNDLLQNAKNQFVEKIFMPNIDSSSIDDVHRVEELFPNQCYAMMGLHPCYVKENYEQELKIVEEWIAKRKYAAIGEIGIDLYWDKSTKTEQEIAFRRQIKWAGELGIPFVIHSRDSLDLTIDIVTELQKGQLTGIFHCFNGDAEQAKKIADVGFLMGIGGVATFKKAGVDKTVAQIDLEHLVLETDAPYLAPTPYRGKQNKPEYIPIIADKISDVQEISVEKVAKTTTENALNLFSKYLN